MSLEDLFRQYAAAHQRPDTGEASWDQMCGSLQFRFGTFLGWTEWPTTTGRTAWNVGLHSGPLNTDPSQAPVGAWHFWEGIDGHTAIDLRGGGTHTGMATYALAESLGKAIGINSVDAYSKAKRGIVTYRGWATNYGGGRAKLPAIAPAATNITPIPAPPTNGEDTVALIKATEFKNGDSYTITDTVITHHKDGLEGAQAGAGLDQQFVGMTTADLHRFVKTLGWRFHFGDWDLGGLQSKLPTGGGTLTKAVVDGKLVAIAS